MAERPETRPPERPALPSNQVSLQCNPLMETTENEPVQPTPDQQGEVPEPKVLQPRIPDRLMAGFEVLLVAITGDVLVVPLVLVIGGFRSAEILENAAVFTLLLAIKASATLALVLLLLMSRGERLGNLGWNRLRRRREIMLGLAAVPFLFILVGVAGLAFQVLFPEWVTEVNPMLEMLRTPRDVLLFVMTSLYVGGLQEEVQRAFILHRFERFLGGSLLGLILWSLFFGLGHAVQGFDNAFKAALLGLFFGILYLKRRDLTSPITAHAAYNVTTVLAYWLWLKS